MDEKEKKLPPSEEENKADTAPAEEKNVTAADDGSEEKSSFDYADNASGVDSINIGGQSLKFDGFDEESEHDEYAEKLIADSQEILSEAQASDEKSEDDSDEKSEGNEESDGVVTEREEAEAEEEPPVPLMTRIKEKVKSFCESCGIPDMLLARFIGVYMIISALNLKSIQTDGLGAVENWKEYVKAVPLNVSLMWIAFGFLMLTFIHTIVPKKLRIFDQLTLFAGTLMFGVNLMWENNNFYLAMGVIFVSVVFINYTIGKLNQDHIEKFPKWASWIIVLICAVGVTSFMAVTTVASHRTFSTSTYDFGIFVQMFHSMATDLTAVTTCERDEFLSHFYIHASFIYYLLVPVYALFPSEDTLLIAQAVLAMGGIIPLLLIAKNHNYKGFPLIAAGLVYIFCAGLLAPCTYDFHENAFLPTLLMWLLYAADKKKSILLYIMSFLVCIVKEDAPLYVMCIAMFFFFDEKSIKRLHGIIIAALSGVYFVLVTNWLAENGDGQMMTSSRFGNLTIDPEEGFGGIIKNVLTNPSYFFSLFTKEDTLIFFLQVMLPLLFMPFFTKKIHRFLLIIPFVIMNLVVGAGYGYAASIGYQYIFGPACLLIYMTLVNCEDLGRNKRNMLVSSAAVASVITAVTLVSGEIRYYENYQSRADHYQALEDCLDSVPNDGRVIANTWYQPHIADREEVYIFDNNDFYIDPVDETNKTLIDVDRYDFYVMSYGDENTSIAIPQLEALGWTKFNEVEGSMVIYVSPDYVPAN
ncbi:MAG: DUF2079 domain-containing protein [Ruminococcus sp.]|nr:DUF2079 domain-containing protein [Ruminococcus sp.]